MIAPNFSEDRERLEKIVQEFAKKAFLTDAVLIFLLDPTFDSVTFFGQVGRRNFCTPVKIQNVFKSQVNLEQLFSQIDYYIIGESAEEIFYIDFAIRHSVKHIPQFWGRDEDENKNLIEKIFDNIVE